MTPRLTIPFDTFAMRVPVPVSQLVRMGNRAWTCGQCPLDGDGQVVRPGELLVQADSVCDMVERLLARADQTLDAVALVIAYFVPGPDGDRNALTSLLRDRFGETPLIVPIAVPHFY